MSNVNDFFVDGLFNFDRLFASVGTELARVTDGWFIGHIWLLWEKEGKFGVINFAFSPDTPRTGIDRMRSLVARFKQTIRWFPSLETCLSILHKQNKNPDDEGLGKFIEKIEENR